MIPAAIIFKKNNKEQLTLLLAFMLYNGWFS